MWRACGVVLLLASATLMIACAQDTSIEKRDLNITVPRWIRNDTHEQVILDCEYEYNRNEEKLVIKWFLNDDSQHIYQWIPAKNSRILSTLFQKYVDMEYVLEPSDDFTKYRRIVLKRPTIEFRGKYECTVSSEWGQGVAEANMEVYAPATNITLTYKNLPDNQVKITCMVIEIYPKPDIQLLAVSEDGDDVQIINSTDYLIEDNGIHGLNITFDATISTFQINASEDTIFRCVVLIEENVYKEIREKKYHPAKEIAILEPLYEIHNKHSSSSLITASFICIIFAILVL